MEEFLNKVAVLYPSQSTPLGPSRSDNLAGSRFADRTPHWPSVGSELASFLLTLSFRR